MSAKISRDQGLLREIFVLVTVMGELFVVESFSSCPIGVASAVNTYKSGGIMDIVVGGFGELRNAACPGIEQLILKAGGNASNDSDDAALLSRGRLLADVPSPTWMELHTAADGSQVLYAVLEDTNEIASFASRGGRLIAACGAVPRTHAGSCRHSCGVCVRRRRSGSPHHRRLRRRVRLRASGNRIRCNPRSRTDATRRGAWAAAEVGSGGFAGVCAMECTAGGTRVPRQPARA